MLSSRRGKELMADRNGGSNRIDKVNSEIQKELCEVITRKLKTRLLAKW
jgi:ribosome-binding factor A